LTALNSKYSAFAVGATSGSCSVPTTNNAQWLLNVNKDSALGTAELKSVTYNGATQSTSSTLLSGLLYSQNVIEFMTLTSNTVSFDFADLPAVHQKLIVRARVYTECTTQNKDITMTLSGGTGTTAATVTVTLATDTETIVEGEVLHTDPTAFTVTLAFGTQGETCRKIVQDLAIYYEECKSYCLSNDCPASGSYFKHPVDARCVSDCPDGYTEDGNNCVLPFSSATLPVQLAAALQTILKRNAQLAHHH
jgi:hypothetical protein